METKSIVFSFRLFLYVVKSHQYKYLPIFDFQKCSTTQFWHFVNFCFRVTVCQWHFSAVSIVFTHQYTFTYYTLTSYVRVRVCVCIDNRLCYMVFFRKQSTEVRISLDMISVSLAYHLNIKFIDDNLFWRPNDNMCNTFALREREIYCKLKYKWMNTRVESTTINKFIMFSFH